MCLPLTDKTKALTSWDSASIEFLWPDPWIDSPIVCVRLCGRRSISLNYVCEDTRMGLVSSLCLGVNPLTKPCDNGSEWQHSSTANICVMRFQRPPQEQPGGLSANNSSIWGFIIAFKKKDVTLRASCLTHLKPSFVRRMAAVKDDKMAPGVLFLLPSGVWSAISNIRERKCGGKGLRWRSINFLQYEIWVTLVSSPEPPRISIHITVWDTCWSCEMICSWRQCVTRQVEGRWTRVEFSSKMTLFKKNTRAMNNFAFE